MDLILPGLLQGKLPSPVPGLLLKLPDHLRGLHWLSLQVIFPVAQEQPVPGLSHHQVEIKALDAAVLSVRRSQLADASRKDLLPFQVRKDPPAGYGGGDLPVVDPQDKQGPDVVKAAPLQVSCHHPVHDLGNGARLKLPEACFQDAGKVLQRQPFLPQMGLHPQKQGQDQLVKAPVLLGFPEEALFFQLPAEGFQGFGRSAFLQMLRQGTETLRHGMASLCHPLSKGQKGSQDLCLILVQLLQVQVLHAPDGPVPFLQEGLPAPDPPAPDIVVQKVRQFPVLLHQGIP